MKELDYAQAFGAWDQTSDDMKSAIARWKELYYHQEPTEDKDPCQRIAYTVVHKLVRAVFSEYKATCRPDFFQNVLRTLNGKSQEAVQLALVGGECYIKPCPVAGGFDFALIPRGNILCFARDGSGELTDVGLVERSRCGGFYDTLLERRQVDERGFLTIENRLYRSRSDTSLGQEVALSQNPAYGALQRRFTFPEAVGGVGLVRVKTPMLNCVDGSNEGVAVYAAAAGLIDRIDENEAELTGEFARGESRIIASRDLLDRDNTLRHHLFLGLDDAPEQVGLHIFSPQLREQSCLARKQEYLRKVESVIGLQRGMLSNVNEDKRTATEISTSQGEFNLTVMDFQRMWQRALEKTVALCAVLARVYGMTRTMPEGLQVDWGNGVLYDEDKLWEDYKDMVARGLIAPEVALGWRFHMEAETKAQREKIRALYM